MRITYEEIKAMYREDLEHYLVTDIMFEPIADSETYDGAKMEAIDEARTDWIGDTMYIWKRVARVSVTTNIETSEEE